MGGTSQSYSKANARKERKPSFWTDSTDACIMKNLSQKKGAIDKLLQIVRESSKISPKEWHHLCFSLLEFLCTAAADITEHLNGGRSHSDCRFRGFRLGSMVAALKQRILVMGTRRGGGSSHVRQEAGSWGQDKVCSLRHCLRAHSLHVGCTTPNF